MQYQWKPPCPLTLGDLEVEAALASDVEVDARSGKVEVVSLRSAHDFQAVAQHVRCSSGRVVGGDLVIDGVVVPVGARLQRARLCRNDTWGDWVESRSETQLHAYARDEFAKGRKLVVTARKPRNTECMERFWRFSNRFRNTYRQLRIGTARLLLMRVAEYWNQVRLRAAWREAKRRPSDDVLAEHPWLHPSPKESRPRPEHTNRVILAPWYERKACARRNGQELSERLAEEKDAAEQPRENDTVNPQVCQSEAERAAETEHSKRMNRLTKAWRALQLAHGSVAVGRTQRHHSMSASDVTSSLWLGFSSVALPHGPFGRGALLWRSARSENPTRDRDLYAPASREDMAIRGGARSVASASADAPVLFFPDPSCPLCQSKADLSVPPDDISRSRTIKDCCSSALLHQDGGPLGVVCLRLQCQNCKALLEHSRAHRADGTWVLALRPDRARALFLSRDTAFDLDLVRSFYGLWIRSGATCHCLADAYAASTNRELHEGDNHLRACVLASLVTYVLGRCLGVGVPIHLGWQTKAMEERLQELLPAVETYFWRKWVEQHAEHCSKTCASTVILDGNLKCFSRQCCAETGEDMVPGTNLQVKRFCGGFTRGTRDRLCANAACQSAAPQLRKLVEGAKSDLQERYTAARRRNAAVGRSCAARDTSGADDVDEGRHAAPFCYAGNLTKATLQQRRQQLGMVGVLAGAFSECQQFAGFQRIFVAESSTQCVQYLSRLMTHQPELKHVIYDHWCQLAPVIHNATAERKSELRHLPSQRRAELEPVVDPSDEHVGLRNKLRALTGVLDRGHGPSHARLRCQLEYSANAHKWCFREVEMHITSREQLHKWKRGRPAGSMIHTCRPVGVSADGGARDAAPIAMPAAMIFAEVLTALDTAPAENDASGTCTPPRANLEVSRNGRHLVLQNVHADDLRKLALVTLTSAFPGTLHTSVQICGKMLEENARIIRITLGRASDAATASPRSYDFHDEATMRPLIEEQPFPLNLVIWEPRDTQALERSWKLLNRCRTTTTFARPSVMWFLLHAQADGQNRRRANGSLFTND